MGEAIKRMEVLQALRVLKFEALKRRLGVCMRSV